MKRQAKRSQDVHDFRERGHLRGERHLLAELVHAHLALANLFSREVGVTTSRLKLLHEFMHCGPEGMSLGDLALRLGVTPALVTRQVKELERDGWIGRYPDASDGRRNIIKLTGEGRTRLLKFHDRAHRFEMALVEGMRPQDVAAACLVLTNLREKLESWRRTGRYLLRTKWAHDGDTTEATA